jgi:hypothetical protein
MADTDLLFEVRTPLGFAVGVTRARWELIITIKHPVMSRRETMVRMALESPDEVRQSRSDADVYLFYLAAGAGRWTCAVAKEAGQRGFLVTAYPTDGIKEGTRVWPR